MNPSLRNLLFFLLLVSHAQGAEASLVTEKIPAYDRLFHRSSGWIGADADYSVALGKNRILWLFGDTFIGKVCDGRRVPATMINNSIGVQHRLDPATARVDFFCGSSFNGQPQSWITPKNAQRWFWPADGVMERKRLFVFLSEMERTSVPSAFRQIGTTLCMVANPLDPPTAWKFSLRNISLTKLSPAENRIFGAAILKADGFVYLYGLRERSRQGKSMILARVPEGHLKDLHRWRFYTGNGWSRLSSRAADLCPDVANEYSVSWLPSLHRYVLICTPNGLSGNIIACTAPNPWGPWSNAKIVYRCPEATWGHGIFCYAAKAHPMLSTAPNELIVTYAANATNPETLLSDARLYWPRFVRVKF